MKNQLLTKENFNDLQYVKYWETERVPNIDGIMETAFNRIDNAWKKKNRDDKNRSDSAINQSITTEARSGQSFRDGQLESGASQLFNLSTTDYITFGVSTNGGTIVAP